MLHAIRTTTKITTPAAADRTKGVAELAGSSSPASPAKSIAATNAATQPPSAKTSRTKPRQTPIRTETASTAMTA